MKLTILLTILCGCLWLEKHQFSALSLNTSGHYILTGPEYANIRPKEANGDHLLKTISIMTSKVDSPSAALECGRQCIATEGCNSFLIYTENRRCYLSELDRCIFEKNIIPHAPGYYFYEIHDANERNKTGTCFKTCLGGNNCTYCGRPFCQGEMCSQCASYCWETDGSAMGDVKLWTHDLRQYNAACFKKWQLLWSTYRKHALGKTPPMAVKLSLQVIYGSDHQSSQFDSVSLQESLLTVGKFINGTAGNFWRAPFQSREIRGFQNSSCKSFYYQYMESCEVGGVTEVQYNENGNRVKEGYAWVTGAKAWDARKVTGFNLWIHIV